MSFQKIKEPARKADEAEGKDREKLVEQLIERLEEYDVIEDVGWTRIQTARKLSELLKKKLPE